MAIKEAKKETCQRVQHRRNAVRGRAGVSVVYSLRQILSSPRYDGGVPPVTDRPISPIMSPTGSDDSQDTSNHDRPVASSGDQIDYRGLSADRILDSPYDEVLNLLKRLDFPADRDLIVETMLHYALIIKGLPDCPVEDLPLAVYFFIEDTFSIQSRIVMCQKIRRYDGKMDVGVMLDTIRMKYDILKKDELLVGTEVRIANNQNLLKYARPRVVPRP